VKSVRKLINKNHTNVDKPVFAVSVRCIGTLYWNADDTNLRTRMVADLKKKILLKVL